MNYLVKDGSYSIIERKALEKILAEQNFSNSDRANPTLAVRSASCCSGRHAGGQHYAIWVRTPRTRTLAAAGVVGWLRDRRRWPQEIQGDWKLRTHAWWTSIPLRFWAWRRAGRVGARQYLVARRRRTGTDLGGVVRPSLIAIERKPAPMVPRSGIPNDTFEAPSVMFTPSSSWMSEMVSSVFTTSEVSAPMGMASGSSTMSSTASP